MKFSFSRERNKTFHFLAEIFFYKLLVAHRICCEILEDIIEIFSKAPLMKEK